MFQTQQTSLIRSWKQKKGKVGCDWEGRGSGGGLRAEISRACSPFAFNCVWVAACLLPFVRGVGLFSRRRSKKKRKEKKSVTNTCETHYARVRARARVHEASRRVACA